MFIRKKLITDISSEEIRRVTELLKANDISYDMKTVTSRWAGSSMADAHLVGQYVQNPSNSNYVYTVYVKPAEYQRAKKVIN